MDRIVRFQVSMNGVPDEDGQPLLSQLTSGNQSLACSPMKNVQVIDGADNAAYDVFSCTDDEYQKIFSAPGQNIEFAEDLSARLGKDAASQLLAPVWKRPLRKHEVLGIHGTLFYELAGKKRAYYPNKKESDLDKSARGWTHG